MCGIAAFFFEPTRRTPEMWEAIRQVFTNNLLHNEERGKIATGIAVINQDGTYQTCKQPVSAHDFIQLPRYQELLHSLSEQTVCVLGHTRKPTKGAVDNPLNNHPLVIGHHIGVHNGDIENDDDLFQNWQFPRAAQVDSEIIFRLFNGVAPDEPDYAQKITSRAALLHGAYATISLDLRFPLGLLAIKHRKPLCLHYHAPWNALIFSSRYIFLRKAFGKSVVTEALESGNFFYFRADALHEKKTDPVVMQPVMPVTHA